MADGIIVPEESEAFRENFRLDRIVNELKNKDLLSYFHHVISDEGKIVCYRFNFCYENDNKSKIVFAIKDITDIVEWANGK